MHCMDYLHRRNTMLEQGKGVELSLWKTVYLSGWYTNINVDFRQCANLSARVLARQHDELH